MDPEADTKGLGPLRAGPSLIIFLVFPRQLPASYTNLYDREEKNEKKTLMKKGRRNATGREKGKNERKKTKRVNNDYFLLNKS